MQWKTERPTRLPTWLSARRQNSRKRHPGNLRKKKAAAFADAFFLSGRSFMRRQYWIVWLLCGILAVTLLMIKMREETVQDVYVSRAMAAKMLTLAWEKDEIIENETEYANVETECVDVDKEDWYAPYIDCAIAQFGMEVTKGYFFPMEALTYGQAETAAKRCGAHLETLSFELDRQDPNKAIPEKLWIEIYEQIILQTGNVEKKELLLLGTPSKVEGLMPWQCLTNSGVYTAAGVALDDFMGQNLKVYVRGSALISVRGVSHNPAVVKNLWIVQGQEQTLQVFISGYYRNFELEDTLERPVEKVMGDLTFENGKLKHVTLKNTVIKGEILSISEDCVEVKGYGKLPLSQPFNVYRIYDGIEEISMEQLEVSNRYTEFVVDQDEICGAIVRAATDAQTIRVLLGTDGFTGYAHQKVVVESSSPYTVFSEKEKHSYGPGEAFAIEAGTMAPGTSVTVASDETAGQLTVTSMNRSQGHPAYRGTLKITAAQDGLYIVNELLLEEYLYGVVPSEMPASYEMEALKVQAVCARSFAVNALNNPRFEDYGADVDDSTATQVYNNTSEDLRVNEAVDACAGQILTWEGVPVQTYFYSTSCGSSSSPADVWLSQEAPPYMQGGLQIGTVPEGMKTELSDEADFKDFIDHYEDKDYFEKDISWFRWKVTLSRENLRTSVDKNLLSRSRTVPQWILVKNDDNTFEQKELDTVGDIVSVTVAERGSSGIVKSVIVEGTQACIKIMGEYNIRLLLAPIGDSVLCDDGTEPGPMNMLPSGYFYITDHKDGTLTVRGGGYGHGAGMSQNGVQALAKRGESFDSILTRYFPGTSLTSGQ